MKMKNNYALVSTIKKFYKPGYRIELISMEDPAGLPPGSIGYVDFVDDAGQIHMRWDSGSSLALIQNVDKFKLIPDSCGTKYVIKGMLENKEVYYKKTSNEVLWNTEWEVPNFSLSIADATLFNSTDTAEKVCSSIGFGDFKIYPVCPMCHKEYSGYPAVSRYDNKTKICDRCGLVEALTDFIEYEKKATNM